MKNNSLIQLLESSGAQYAFYFRKQGQSQPLYAANCERFHSASLIKLPLLLAWVLLERSGEVHRTEVCDLDAEPQVQGAGFSWMLRARQLPFQDVLLLMISLSDNLCTNLILRRIGLERAQKLITEDLSLPGMELQRKLMDYEARDRGLDNYLTPAACIHLFDLFRSLTSAEQAWVYPMLEVNQDDLYLRRSIQRDTFTFYHKTGSMTNLAHDWGFTNDCDIFLLMQNIPDEPAAYDLFGQAGHLLVTP